MILGARLRPDAIAGACLVLAGLLVPSTTIVALFRPGRALSSDPIVADLTLGAHLLRIGLIALGLFMIVLARTSIWSSRERGGAAIKRAGARYENAMVAGILVIALALRLHELSSGLWYDEILTYVSYMQSPFGEAMTTYDSASKNQHFLFTGLAHLSFWFFGDSVWALRLPAVLLGVGSVWAAYRLAREVGEPLEAILVAGLLALAYQHIWFSQNARGYTGLLLWTLLSSWCLVRGLREYRPRIWLLYAVSVALGMYTHVTMFFVIISHLLIYAHAVIRGRADYLPRKWSSFVLGFGLGGLLTLVLYALVLPQVLFGPAVHEVSTVPAWKNPLSSLLELVEGRNPWLVGLIAIGGGAVMIAGLVGFARSQPVMIALFAIPVLVTAGLGLAMGHHLWPRYFFFAMGFGVIVMVRGALVLAQSFEALLRESGVRAPRLQVATALSLILVSAVTMPLAYGPKQDYSGTLAFVRERQEPGDAVVTAGLASMPFHALYKVDWSVAESLEALNSIRRQATRTWVIYTLPMEVQAVHPDIAASVQHDFSLIRRFDGTLGGGALYVYRADAPLSQLPSTGS